MTLTQRYRRMVIRVARAWRKTILEGDLIPKGYGISYYEPDRPVAVAHPLPFNLLIGWWLIFVWWLTCPPWRFVMWRAFYIRRQAYEDGFADGRAWRPDQPSRRLF